MNRARKMRAVFGPSPSSSPLQGEETEKRIALILWHAVFCVILTVAFAPSANAQWNGFAHDSQHSADSPVAADSLNEILWTTPVDLDPPTGDFIAAHYGTPLVTAADTVIVPVKTAATGSFRVDARNATDGSLIWTLPSDYLLPQSTEIPVFGPTLTSQAQLYFPGIGGTVYFVDDPDTACSGANCPGQLVFFGAKNYRKHKTSFNARVMIDTPLTADSSGNIYFGFIVIAGHGSLHDVHGKKLKSGIARISASGKGSWIAATKAAADKTITGVSLNCAPALSPDGKTVYVAVSDANGAGYLVALNSTTLAPIARVRLKDPDSGSDASLSADSSSSPTVGPDGDVYYGVLENPCCTENHHRGFLLHFNATLSQTKTPGAFGWDTTASIVPASAVPSYGGSSSYLLATKYNNYDYWGGNGLNEVAVLDPDATETDPITGLSVMNEVETVLGPTPDGEGGVKEWCINSAAVDPGTDSIMVNSEDGNLYRWNLASNTLSQTVTLTTGYDEAYTPTVIGVDGTVYAIQDGILFAVGN